ncbi:MAG TPA: methylenetetrahydrofolate reductase C-terminal domain-containing protein [Burkholderiales bacterium]
MSLRGWSVKHARLFESLWRVFERLLPKARPLVQWAGPARAERLLRPIERALKRLFFECRMCGRCALSASGMSCPMNCPKQHRNGPCGGVRADGGCEIQPAMRCVWLDSLDGAAHMRDGSGIARAQPAVDFSLEGTSAWVRKILEAPLPAVEPSPARRGPVSGFERACLSGRFVVTAEITPPDSADGAELLKRAEPLRGAVDAINVTDGAGAHCHMSSLAASALLAADGHEPIFQISCRDRNRIAMQGDILGAAALGLSNLLCITGDHTAVGDHPQAKSVFDLDAVTLLEAARRMRDAGSFASGRKLGVAPRLFLGATMNPFAPPHEARVANLERKLAAGAQFIETQYCLDVPQLERFLARMRERGLEGRFHLIVGTGPIVSARLARWMLQHVPGMHIPQALIARLERAADPVREGVRICVETVERLRELRGVAGVHLMAHRREHLIAEIIELASLRRQHEGTETAPA